jgi:site-specific DNA-methyltransferase (adenine-specific)
VIILTLARKPVSAGKTVAQNVLEYGTGGVNIDACRIAYEVGFKPPQDANVDHPSAWTGANYNERGAYILNAALKQRIVYTPLGRHPANIVFQHAAECVLKSCQPGCPIGLLDIQSGFLTSGGANGNRKASPNLCMSGPNTKRNTLDGRPPDNGGASRFFILIKP